MSDKRSSGCEGTTGQEWGVACTCATARRGKVASDTAIWEDVQRDPTQEKHPRPRRRKTANTQFGHHGIMLYPNVTTSIRYLDCALYDGSLDGGIRQLVEKEGGVGVNSRLGNGRTALHVTVSTVAFETVQLLLKIGADANAKDDDDAHTPLIMALKGNDIDLPGGVGLVKCLIDHVISTLISS